jgi:TatD DNase family protein
MLIDSHCHLDMPAFDDDRDDTIERARDAGVEVMLEIAGSDIATGSLDRGMDLAERYPFIFAAVGVHPHEASLYDDALEARLVDLSSHGKVVAWGEIGLDYHYDFSPRDRQRTVFRRQIELAEGAGLPLSIHTREAEEHTVEILSASCRKDEGLRGVMHCFTGSKWLAQAAVALGFMISFSGVVTFKNAEALREIASELPADRILVETDSPYLAPIPYRGKRNEPAFVVTTARFVARLRGVEPEEFARQTSENFRRLFTRAGQ